MTANRLLATLRLVAWTAGLVVSARLLLAAGSGTLSVPVTSFDDLSVWVSETPPADMVIAVLRLAALAAVTYLLAATVLAVIAGVVRVRPLVAAADVLSPAVVRRIATGGSGIGLVLGGAVAGLPTPDLPFGGADDPVALVAAPTGPASAPAASTATMARVPAPPAAMTPADPGNPSRVPASTATMTHVGPGTPSPGAVAPAFAPAATPVPTAAGTASAPVTAEATMTRIGEPPPPSVTMTRLPDPGTASPVSATPAAFTPTASMAAIPVREPAALEIDPTAWVVEPGDSLWSIAEDVVTPPDGSRPAERTVARYWQRLAAANRDNLVDPNNPDLLVPGQRLVVPATDA